MRDTPLLSRIARQLTLRRAERAAYLSSAVAVVLTICVVGTGFTTESNPVSAWLIEQMGIYAWALSTPVAIFGLFRLYQWTAKREPGLTRAFAWTTAGVLALDAVGNITTTTSLELAGVSFSWLIPSTVLLFALGLAARWEISKLLNGCLSAVRRMRPAYSTIRTVGFTMLIVLAAIVAPISFTGAFSPVGTTEAATPGEVTFTAHDSRVRAIDPADGSVVWTYDSGNAAVMQDVQRYGDYVYVSMDDGVVKKLKISDGTQVWSASTDGSSVNSIAPGPDGTYIYIGTQDGDAKRAFTANGTIDWAVNIEGSSSYLYGVSASPSGKYVYTASTSGARQLNAADGTENWFYSTSSKLNSIYAGPNGSNVYTGGMNGVVRSLNVADGTQSWSSSVEADVIELSVHPSGNSIYTIDDFSSLYRHDSTGTLITKFDQIGTYGFSVAVGANGDNVYSGETDNSRAHYANDINTTKWTYSDTTNEHIVGSGTQANGVYDIASTSAVSGTVTDSDGNVLDGATVSTGTGVSTTTASDGSYTLDLKDGTYDITASKSGYISQTNSVSVSGSAITGNNYTLAMNGVSGRVVACDITDPTCKDPSGVAGATVEIYGVNYTAVKNQYDDVTSDAEAEQKAQELLEQAENLEPSKWKSNLELTGADGLFNSVSEPYVAVHSSQQWGLAGYTDSPDLRPPKYTVPANQKVVLSAWDPSKGGIQDGVDSSLPGATMDDVNVTVEQLGPGSGGVTSSESYELDSSRNGYQVGFIGKTHAYREVELAPGYYRVSVEDSSISYVIRAGETPFAGVQKDLRNEAGNIFDQANDTRSHLDTGVFERKVVETGAKGHFSVQINNSSVQTVGAYAYKAGQNLNPDSDRSMLKQVRDARAAGYNGSVYVPREPVHLELPANGVQIKTVRISAAPFEDIESLDELALEQLATLLDTDVSSLTAEWGLPASEYDRNTIEDRYNSSREQVKTVPDTTVNVELPEDVSGQTDQELLDRIRAMEEELRDARSDSGVETPPPETDISDGVFDGRYQFPGSIAEETTSVIVQWEDGTTESMPSEYWHIDSGMTGYGSDAVVVENYPVPSHRAVADVRVDTVVDEEDVARSRSTIQNPAFQGDIPDVTSLDVSTLTPGTGDRVEVAVRAEEGTGYGKITGLEVYGPNDSSLNTTVNQTSDTAAFTTTGEGSHFVRVLYETQSGHQFSQSFRVRADPQAGTGMPTVRAETGPGGPFAIAGDGLRNARIKTDEATKSTTVTAVIPSDGRISDLHVQVRPQMEGESLNVRVVKGTQEQAIRNHVSVTVHEQLSDSALVWRASRQPITTDDSTRYGSIEERNDGEKHIIETYTDSRGRLSMTIKQDPGYLDRAAHSAWSSSVLQSASSISLTVLFPTGTGNSGFLWGIIPLVVVRYRRRRPPRPPEPPSMRESGTGRAGGAA